MVSRAVVYSYDFNTTSVNAVKTQIWIAVSVYLLGAIVEKELNIEQSSGEILLITGQ